MFGKKRTVEAQPVYLEVTELADGQRVVKLPLPSRAAFSPFVLADTASVETILTLRFANRSARYRVTGVRLGGMLVAELVQEGVGRLPPLIEADPETMLIAKGVA